MNWNKFAVAKKMRVTDVSDANFASLVSSFPSLSKRIEEEKKRMKVKEYEEAQEWIKKVLKRKKKVIQVSSPDKT